MITGSSNTSALVAEYDLTKNTVANIGVFSGLDTTGYLFMDTVQVGNKLLYVSSTPLWGGKRTGEMDLFNLTVDVTKYPDVPANVNATLNNLQLVNDEVVSQNTGKYFTLKLIPRKPLDMPLVNKIFDGDGFSCPNISNDINLLAIPELGQPALTITNMQQIATGDYQIHDSQYNLQGMPATLLIEKGL